MGVAGAIAQSATTPTHKAPPPPPPKVTKPSPPETSAQKGQDNWTQAATPGAEHKVLEPLAGHWKAHVTVRIDPGHVSEESDGTADGTMLLGGRYLQLIHKGTLMGQPFEGIMVIGYDNIAKKYVAQWIDNMGTSFIHYDGTYDKHLKRLMMGARFVDPMTRLPLKVRAVTTFIDATSWTYEEFSTPGEGKEWQSLKITFKKA
jgi:hypothetical protein